MKKDLVRAFLAGFKEYADGTPSSLDDFVYNLVRDWALRNGLIDPGGADDPLPRPEGGDGGGP